MKKRSVRLVHEHFEEVLTQLSGFVAFVKRALIILRKVRLTYKTHAHDAAQPR